MGAKQPNITNEGTLVLSGGQRELYSELRKRGAIIRKWGTEVALLLSGDHKGAIITE